jgi:8-amino-7-oxononanoate synthase
MTWADSIRDTLARLRADGLYRQLAAIGPGVGPRATLGGREVLIFASNDYLGLAGDPRVADAARRAIDRWGWGAGGSRLLAGHTEAHAALEADLAAFTGTEAALVFPSGYAANLGVLGALAGRGDVVVMDRANHASLVDGVRLSGARLLRYPQADAARAEALLVEHLGAPGRLLVTDTVFSMDGRIAPLAALAAAASRQGALVVLDEAHATGVLGPTGAGLAQAVGLPRGAVAASVGTLSKALGGVGGFVAAGRDVIDLLVNRARSFIYTTALPAAACEAARAALAIACAEPDRRTRLRCASLDLRRRLAQEGFDVGEAGDAVRARDVSRGSRPPAADAGTTADGGGARERHAAYAAGSGSPECDALATPIIPVIAGSPERALGWAAALLERGVLCPAIRPPTVPAGAARLRISLTALHTAEDVARLVGALVAARDAV